MAQQRKLALNDEQVEERSNICSTRGVRASSSAPRGIWDPIVAASVRSFTSTRQRVFGWRESASQRPHTPNCDTSLHQCDR